MSDAILAYLRKGGAISPSFQPIGGELHVSHYILHDNNELELVAWRVQMGKNAAYVNPPNPMPDGVTAASFTGKVTGYMYVINERNKIWFTHQGSLTLLRPNQVS